MVVHVNKPAEAVQQKFLARAALKRELRRQLLICPSRTEVTVAVADLRAVLDG